MKNQVLTLLTILAFLGTSIVCYGQNPRTPKVAFGKGITYMPQDSSFKVKFHFRIQNLLTVDYNESSEDFTTNFLVRRSRLKFSGFAFTPALEYKAEMGLTNRDISIDKEDGNTRDAARIILDAVVKWKFVDNWALWVGQTKLPGNRERVISSANLQFVDRSIVNGRYNIDRDAGLQLRGKINMGNVVVAPALAVSKGEGRNITASNYGGLNYTAHVDFLPFGKFAAKGDYVSSDLYREPKPKLSIGLTYDYNDGAVRQGGQLGSFVTDSLGNYVENSLSTVFVDLMFKYRGFSILSEYAQKSAADQIVDVSKGYLTGTGFTAQAGYLFNNNVELAFRYTTIRKDDDFSGITDEDQYTLGLSKYIVNHSLKFQTDLTRRVFPGDEAGRYMFRMQVEMQF